MFHVEHFGTSFACVNHPSDVQLREQQPCLISLLSDTQAHMMCNLWNEKIVRETLLKRGDSHHFARGKFRMCNLWNVCLLIALLSYQRASGAVTTYQDFDADLHPSTSISPVTDTISLCSTFSYDLLGRVIAVSQPNRQGGSRTVQTVYTDGARTVTRISPSGKTSVRMLTAGGRLDSVTDNLGNTTKFGYTGGAMSSVDEQGFDTRIFQTNRDGLPMSEGYGSLGLVTTYARDENGAVTRMTQPGGLVTAYDPDAFGRVTHVSFQDTLVRSLAYDNTDPNYQFTPKSTKDELSAAVTSVTRSDVRGRPAAWTTTVMNGVSFPAAAGAPAVPAQQDISGEAQRQNGGALVSVTDGNGKNITYTYGNKNTTLQSITDQCGLGGATHYYASGAVSDRSDERGNVSRYIYDAASGDVMAVRFPDGRGVLLDADDDGNAVRATYVMSVNDDGSAGAGARYAVHKDYDGLGRLWKIQDPEGSQNETILTYVEGSGLIDSVTTPDYVLTHKYDGAGREKDVYGPGARHTHFEYDATGQIASVNRDGYVEAYTYDAKGRRDSTSVTGQGTISSVYTDAWDVGSQSAGGNVIANFWYDSLHRPVKTQLPGGKESTRGYDAAGHVVRSSDPKQQQFWLQSADNGQPQALNLISGNTASAIQTYSFDGYVPTSDGSSSWHIDSMGRISDSSGGETFAYDHPRGFLTARNYGAAHLTYNYGSTPFVQSVTETGSSTSVAFGRSAGGLLNSETYSNGIYKGYGYTGDMDVNYLEYTKNGTVLASFAAGFAGPGMRSSVSLMPGNETINYGYDADKHINQETHSIGGVTTSTGYTYNSTGTRQTRTGHGGGTDTYHVNARYELTGAELGDGTVLACRYDDNGNTILKSRAVAGTLSVTYKNLTGKARTFTYTAAGAAAVKLTFPATQLSDGYKTILAGGMSLSGAVSFTVSPDEADASATISIARISAASTAGSWVREEDAAAIAGGVQREEDAQAPTGIALQDFGGTTQDSISWSTPSATPESFTYGWDALDQMTGAEHWLGDLRHDGAVFGRSGGWQIGTLTVNGDVREFKHGYDGSILSETTPANGTRTYINGGIDHVMWSLDSMGAETTKYWLNDINGSVYGLAGAAGNVLERQRMTAYGKVSLTDAAGAPQVFSTTGNRTGYQGLMGVPEVGVDNSRHRMYDPMTGRFLSRDPLGMVNGADVMNFCGGDPVNRTDPWGTRWRKRNGEWVWVNDGDGPLPTTPMPLESPELPTVITFSPNIASRLSGQFSAVQSFSPVVLLHPQVAEAVAQRMLAAALAVPGSALLIATASASIALGGGNDAMRGISIPSHRPTLSINFSVEAWRDAERRPYNFYRDAERNYCDNDTGKEISPAEVTRRRILLEIQRDPAKRVYPQAFSRINYLRLSDNELASLAVEGDGNAIEELKCRGKEHLVDDLGTEVRSTPDPDINIDIHHIATIYDGKVGWGSKFKYMFSKLGLDVEGDYNKVPLQGHVGPHPQWYHEVIYARLSDAARKGGKTEFLNELGRIRNEILDPNSIFNIVLTNGN